MVVQRLIESDSFLTASDRSKQRFHAMVILLVCEYAFFPRWSVRSVASLIKAFGRLDLFIGRLDYLVDGSRFPVLFSGRFSVSGLFNERFSVSGLL